MNTIAGKVSVVLVALSLMADPTVYLKGPPLANCTCAFFKDGDTITIEPWRASAFPVIKDLVVDRSAFDRIIQAGGYVSVNTGQAQDGNCDTHRKRYGC